MPKTVTLFELLYCRGGSPDAQLGGPKGESSVPSRYRSRDTGLGRVAQLGSSLYSIGTRVSGLVLAMAENQILSTEMTAV